VQKYSRSDFPEEIVVVNKGYFQTCTDSVGNILLHELESYQISDSLSNEAKT
jgi:hypothetical protein